MFKTSMLMLAAVASVGVTLASSSAEARPGFHGGFRGGFHRPHFRPHFHPHRHVRWQRPWVYGAATAAVAAPAYAAVAPRPAAAAPGPCTCLTKEYTQDRQVVFADRCTKEMAAAPIGGPQQQGQAQPQPEPGEAEPMPTK